MDRATNRPDRQATSAEAASPSLKPARRTRGGVAVDSPWVLRTSRLRLRPLVAADREPFIEMLRESRASLATYVPLHEPGESDDHLFDRQLALTHASNACPDCAVRRVIERDGRLIGAINVNDIQTGEHRSGEIVIWLTSSAIGQGFGVEAINATAEHAFAARPKGLGVSLLFALVAPSNRRALGAFSNARFCETPGVPLVELDIGGSWRPHAIMIREAARTSSSTTTLPAGAVEPRETAKIVVRRLMASAMRAGA